MRKQPTKLLAYTAILVAFGIAIPMVMPKIIIGPASFTLGSHVPIFIGMLISPIVAILVVLGTSLGFLLAGFPIVIVCRAISHLLFTTVGVLYLKNHRDILEKPARLFIFTVLINILHGLAEFLVVLALTAGEHTGGAYVWSLAGMVGLCPMIHGSIDFYIAYYIWKFLKTKVGIDFSVTTD